MEHEVLQLKNDVEVHHIGPDLEKGRLPAVFYFALSASESLHLDPYNQPALYLQKKGIRVFSMNIPAHGPNLSALDAIGIWAKEFEKGKDPITPFVETVLFAIEELLSRGLIFREKLGVMGLSRGGLIAAHVAAKYPEMRALVGFAPMTELTSSKEFVDLKENKGAKRLNLVHFAPLLYNLPIRFYMGNRDTRTGTDRCFHLVQTLADTAFEKGVRSPPVEMIVTPSIGHMGHGTSKEAFEAGADWIGRKLGAIR